MEHSRLYLTYKPEISSPEASVEGQLASLRNAFVIADLLNRTLILPTFTCRECPKEICRVRTGKCSIQAHLHISQLDKHLDYREHMFLENKFVPKEVKLSKSPPYFILTEQAHSYNQTMATLYKENVLLDPSADEIVTRLESVRQSVLVVENIARSLPKLHKEISVAMKRKLEKGIKRCLYNQNCPD